MKKTLLTKILLVALSLAASAPAMAMKVTQQASGSEESLTLTCQANDPTCQALCHDAHQCILATNTCENCASAEDLTLIGIFRDIDTIYTRGATPINFSSFQKWMGETKKVFIDKNSTLDIMNSASPTKSTAWAEKLNVICGVSGEHQIIADAISPIQPAVLICDNGDTPYFYKLKYRPDYTSEVLKNSLTEQISPYMLWPQESLKALSMSPESMLKNFPAVRLQKP